MKTYYINVCPSSGIGIGFISMGNNENHALAELTRSLRMSIKIFNAHIEKENMSREIFKDKKERNVEILRTLRKPGRYAKQGYFYSPNSWPKVTIKEIQHAVTAAYVQEVWLGK